MAVAIRLKRIGKPHQAHYRIVAIEKTRRPQGRPLEILGTYNPRAEKAKDKVVVQQARIDYWLKVGARPSETVATLLKAAAKTPAPAAK
ncbi:MAG: 30S ribosomal protein S16 [Elusimicrobia bacterium]|nr:30S ribosomal protein S16 [Elusimicrobiota bacterium]